MNKLRPICLLACILCLGSAHAASWMESLSQIESGDNDFAVGAAGEVSRYQILPAVWKTATEIPVCQATNRVIATQVASVIWGRRLFKFIRSHETFPSSEQIFFLWSCPTRVDHPTRFKQEIAARFANLCESRDQLPLVYYFIPTSALTNVVFSTATKLTNVVFSTATK